MKLQSYFNYDKNKLPWKFITNKNKSPLIGDEQMWKRQLALLFNYLIIACARFVPYSDQNKTKKPEIHRKELKILSRSFELSRLFTDG
jgi:hypothetical protein